MWRRIQHYSNALLALARAMSFPDVVTCNVCRSVQHAPSRLGIRGLQAVRSAAFINRHRGFSPVSKVGSRLTEDLLNV